MLYFSFYHFKRLMWGMPHCCAHWSFNRARVFFSSASDAVQQSFPFEINLTAQPIGAADCDLRLLLSQVSKEKLTLLSSLMCITGWVGRDDLCRTSVLGCFVLCILSSPLCASASSDFDSLWARVHCWMFHFTDSQGANNVRMNFKLLMVLEGQC